MRYHQLTREQRYAIYLGLQEKDTLTAIAQRIGVNKSTVSREITRNKNRFGKYGWRMADDLSTTIYFADSYASWQKDAIENTNKLVR